MDNRGERDSLRVSLEDTALLAELELLSRLIIAANECEGRLGKETIDALLAGPTRAEAPDEDR